MNIMMWTISKVHMGCSFPTPVLRLQLEIQSEFWPGWNSGPSLIEYNLYVGLNYERLLKGMCFV